MDRFSERRVRNQRDSAARWVTLEDAGALGESERRERDAWRSADPAHAREHARAHELLDLFDEAAGSLAGGDADAELAGRLAGLKAEAAASARSRPGWRWPAMAGGAIAAALLLAVGVSTYLGVGDITGDRAQMATATSDAKPVRLAGTRTSTVTKIGQQRTVVLDDGTRVTLNTGTSLSIDFRTNQRIVKLGQGQALFEVAHDRTRPFIVLADGNQVEALGTVFEVKAESGRFEVMLVEGSVEVRSTAPHAGRAAITPTRLVPGQQLVATAVAPPRVLAVDTDRQLLWRRSMVRFDNASLAAVVAELNRYSDAKLVIADREISDMRLSGIFRTDDPGNFAKMVGAMLPVEPVEDEDGSIELRARGPGPR